MTHQLQTRSGKNASIAEALTAVLADTYNLMFRTQTTHWNATGPLFKSVHDLTDEQYNDLFQAIDALAERIRALGSKTPYSLDELQGFARTSSTTKELNATSMVSTLAADHAALAERFRDLADLAGDHRDGATEDLANARMAFHEQAAWMLEALIE